MICFQFSFALKLFHLAVLLRLLNFMNAIHSICILIWAWRSKRAFRNHVIFINAHEADKLIGYERQLVYIWFLGSKFHWSFRRLIIFQAFFVVTFGLFFISLLSWFWFNFFILKEDIGYSGSFSKHPSLVSWVTLV